MSGSGLSQASGSGTASSGASSLAITLWVRVEPQNADAAISVGPQGCVLDPLWMLTRQWQLGEFQGADAGTAVDVALEVTTVPLTAFSPGAEGGAALPTTAALPLEVQVERESVLLGLRGSIQLGLRFESLLLGQVGAGASFQTLVGAFRTAYPIAMTQPANLVADPRTAGLLAALNVSPVTDGVALAEALLAANASAPAGSGLLPPAQLPAAASSGGQMLPTVQAALTAFLGYRRSLFDEPPGLPPTGATSWNPAPSWDPTRLRYAFSVDSSASSNDLPLAGPEFTGGALDWYDLDAGGTAPADAPQGAATTSLYRFLPHPLEFPGMPRPRFWEFEDARTDYGQIDAEPVDLVKVLLAEASLLYGNDWIGAPVPLPRAARASVGVVVVTDDFGQRLLVPPTTVQVPPTGQPWSMFVPYDLPSGTDAMVVVPALGLTVDGKPLEHVEFMLDTNAMVAWGAELLLPGPLDNGVDTLSAYLTGRPAAPTAAAAAQSGGTTASSTIASPLGAVAPNRVVTPPGPVVNLQFVRILASPPQAVGDAPLSVTFGAQVLGTNPGPWTYSWNFGDGATSSQQNPVHVYASAGAYSASVTVTDPTGKQWTGATIPVTVESAPAIQYQLANTFPSTWVPLMYVMSQDPDVPGAFFQRAQVPGFQAQLGALLASMAPPSTQQPFVLQDRAIPETGLAARRFFRYARSSDGGTHLWLARRVGYGRGTGLSGLAFDQIVPEPPPPSR